jgi:hypothetical protein
LPTLKISQNFQSGDCDKIHRGNRSTEVYNSCPFVSVQIRQKEKVDLVNEKGKKKIFYC